MTAPEITRAGLTPALRFCFNAIEAHIIRHGCAPSFDEIKDALHLTSKGFVHRMVNELVARGWITYTPTKRRSISIVPSSTATGYRLPAAVEAALIHYCARRGIAPAAVVVDAVECFIGNGQRDAA